MISFTNNVSLKEITFHKSAKFCLKLSIKARLKTHDLVQWVSLFYKKDYLKKRLEIYGQRWLMHFAVKVVFNLVGIFPWRFEGSDTSKRKKGGLRHLPCPQLWALVSSRETHRAVHRGLLKVLMSLLCNLRINF